MLKIQLNLPECLIIQIVSLFQLSVQWLNSKFNEKTITMHNISITISIRHTPASKTMKRTQSKMMTGIFGVRIEYVTK